MLPGSNMQFQIKAICYDHHGVTERAGNVNPHSEPEKKIRLFDSRVVQFYRPVDPESFKVEWVSDGQVHITVNKSNGASYWKQITTADKKRKPFQWREVAMKY